MESSFPRPRAAYIHVPFCQHRCGYCNFTLVADRADLVPRYLQAIALELTRSIGTTTEVDTLYFGGGTPTFLESADFIQLAKQVQRFFSLAEGYEWTVEANPNDLTTSYIKMLVDLGVTRVSLGGQSLNARKLAYLERSHTAGEISRVIEQLHHHGLTVALDLIFAVPGETLETWRADLLGAIQLAPSHISTYGLTIEKGTSFWTQQLHGKLTQLDEELQRTMYLLAIDLLKNNGYEHYEISNFAKRNFRSRHNETYWLGEEYYALGPGAARYVAGVRSTNHRSTTTYLKRVLAGQEPTAEREEASSKERAHEFLVFGLRRLEGVTRKEFKDRFGYAIEELVQEPLQKMLQHGLLEETAGKIRLTHEGLLVSDAIWPELL